MSRHPLSRQALFRWAHPLASAALLALVLARPAPAQLPAPPPAPVIAPYRAPVIALVQPPSGGSIPQDRPAVVLRFAAGEPNDPIDLQSLRVTVDGIDRSAGFQVAAGEAWGSIGNASDGPADPITPGPHVLAARICSTRGACAELQATVTVVAVAAEGSKKDDRKARVLEALIEALRRLIRPE